MIPLTIQTKRAYMNNGTADNRSSSDRQLGLTLRGNL